MYSSNGKYLFSLSERNAVVTDMDTGAIVLTMDEVHQGGFFRQQKDTLIWLSRIDGSIYLANLDTGRWISQMLGLYWQEVHANNTGTTLFVVESTSQIVLYDFSNWLLMPYEQSRLEAIVHRDSNFNYRMSWETSSTAKYTLFYRSDVVYTQEFKLVDDNIEIHCTRFHLQQQDTFLHNMGVQCK